MKRFILLATIALLAFGAPALACGGAKAAKTESAKSTYGKVQSEIVRSDNGVKVILTSSDAETVKQLQARARTFLAGECSKSCPMKAEGAKHKIKNIDNGVVIMASTGCAQQAKQMQEYAEKRLKDGAFLRAEESKGQVADAS
ncbi:MAG: hypothetical protein D6738_12815 [Acidobacteria bacterium]|nr:MAG: hypothetical protein D6738_12815 [Acidobacteriota bacterium]